MRIPKPRRLLSALSDERLVEHVRKGEDAAFEVLYDRHATGILGFCRHMLGSTADAEDAVQHTFIAAHSDIQRAGSRDLHVKAWLYTIARNRCLSVLRARREHVSDDAIDVAGGNLAGDVQQREDLRALVADIRKLPDDQREALVLAEVGDLSHDDIGTILGCEASKVKSLVFQARSALIDRRTARETPCEEIREQIATLRGGALRRSHLRHHIESCPGCAEYRDEVRRQRAMLALALPVVPSAALKAHVLGGIGLGGSSAVAGAGGAGASATGLGMAQAGVAKIAIAAVVLAGGAGTAAVAEHGHVPLLHHSGPAAKSSSTTHAPAAVTKTTTGAVTSSMNAATAGAVAQEKAARKHVGSSSTASHRSGSGSTHGFTPQTGTSNGAAAKQFAATRGNGKHSGITKTHTNNARAHHKPAVRHVAAPPRKPATTPKSKVPASTPKTTQPTITQPTTTQTQPAPQPTTTAPAAAPTKGSGGGSGGGTTGKVVNGVNRVSTTDTAG